MSIPYGQKCVHGGSKWRAGTKGTDVRLDEWCEGGLGNRGTTAEAARQCSNDRKEWRPLAHMLLNEFHEAIFAWPVSFRTALPCSGGSHLERGVMPLHDAVGINCEKGITTENQGAGATYKG